MDFENIFFLIFWGVKIIFGGGDSLNVFLCVFVCFLMEFFFIFMYFLVFFGIFMYFNGVFILYI